MDIIALEVLTAFVCLIHYSRSLNIWVAHAAQYSCWWALDHGTCLGIDAWTSGILPIWHIRHWISWAAWNWDTSKTCCSVWHVTHLTNSGWICSGLTMWCAIYNWCTARILHSLLPRRICITWVSAWINSSIVMRLILNLTWMTHCFLLRTWLRLILAAIVTRHLSVFLARLWAVSTNWVKSWTSFWSVMHIFLILMRIGGSNWSSSLVNILIWT